jgi:hypothetical protein
MLCKRLQRIVHELFDLRREMLADEHVQEARRHLRGALREKLLAVRSLVDGALARLDEQEHSEALVRVPVEE